MIRSGFPRPVQTSTFLIAYSGNTYLSNVPRCFAHTQGPIFRRIYMMRFV